MRNLKIFYFYESSLSKQEVHQLFLYFIINIVNILCDFVLKWVNWIALILDWFINFWWKDAKFAFVHLNQVVLSACHFLVNPQKLSFTDHFILLDSWLELAKSEWISDCILLESLNKGILYSHVAELLPEMHLKLKLEYSSSCLGRGWQPVPRSSAVFWSELFLSPLLILII